MSLRRAGLAISLLASLLSAHWLCSQEAGAAPFGKLQPLEYSVLDVTLELSPAAIARSLKARDYLHTKTRRRNGLETSSFTADRGHRLYEEVHLASCPETGQSVGLYVVGRDGAAMQALARQRYGLSGLDLEQDGEDGISGAMRLGRTYRKHYPNVSISFYENKGFGSFTLAFESPDALAACRRQQEETARQEALLRQQIEAESSKSRRVDD